MHDWKSQKEAIDRYCRKTIDLKAVTGIDWNDCHGRYFRTSPLPAHLSR